MFSSSRISSGITVYIPLGGSHGGRATFWPIHAQRLTWLREKGGRMGRLLRITITYLLIHIGWLVFREKDLAMLARHFSLNPLAAPVSEWRMGAAFAVEAALYGFPLLWLLSFLQKRGLMPGKEDIRFLTWRGTLLQGTRAAVLLIVIVLHRCRTGSDFIYFQF